MTTEALLKRINNSWVLNDRECRLLTIRVLEGCDPGDVALTLDQLEYTKHGRDMLVASIRQDQDQLLREQENVRGAESELQRLLTTPVNNTSPRRPSDADVRLEDVVEVNLDDYVGFEQPPRARRPVPEFPPRD